MPNRQTNPMTVRQRFLTKVDHRSDSECWLWTGAKNNRGYGQIAVGFTMKLAHRVAYELNFGSIPTNLQLDHLCHNRSCVNPAHLELVTNRENARRGNGRQIGHRYPYKVSCPQGHPYDMFNTSTWISPTPSRVKTHRGCKICHAKRERERRRRDFNYVTE